MNESTARADRFDLQTSTSSFFLWEVPQKPVAVRIPYPLIDRLEREAVESFRSVTSRGSEVGGLLLGEVTPGNPTVVSVAEYQLIDCDYARGPLYRLSDGDLQRFQQAIQQRGSSGAGIAGFFRTHTRKGITLDPDDLTVLDALFREPHHIALLIRPFATKASTAGIFLREGGAFSCEASCLEFPFRVPPAEAKSPAPGQEAKAPAAPVPAPPPARPAARAQIVPIASRREISLLGGTVEEKPVEASPSRPEVHPEPKPEAKVEARPEAKAEPKVETRTETKPEAKVEPKPEPKSAPKVEAKAETKSAPKVEPTPKTEPKTETKAVVVPAVREVEVSPKEKEAVAIPPVSLEEPAASSGKTLKLVLAALAATLLFVVLFVYPGLMRTSSKAPAAAQSDSSPLQLRVERTNGALLLTWNRDSDAVRSATKAVLTINDGPQHENVDMDLAQLRNGSIVYSPQTSDISFQMEVTGKDAAKTTSESVRVLRTRPSPLEEQNAAQAAAAGKPAVPPTGAASVPGAPNSTTPNATAATANPANPAAPAPETETPAEPESKPVAASRPFSAPSLSARLRPTLSSDLPDAPAVAGGAAIPRVNLNSVAATPSAPIAAPAPPSAAASPATPKSGGKIQQAVLISKKDPEYPKLARQTGARGTVRLSATIGKDGHVKAVRVLSGHPMLQSAAVDAVKQWVYRPTLLNGQPVETDTEIVLNFVGDR
ncbi:MAG: TonB family protein [Acidobacteria bacterium]|nr:TonB family protein [Acidobacteriota bacterium]